MSRKFSTLIFAVLLISTTILNNVPSAHADSPQTWPFTNVWQVTDYLVGRGAVAHSWYWGPAPFARLNESYVESPGNSRLVQYYDKSRMGINDPFGDVTSPWYVTNGLLVKELVSGQIQTGDNTFETQNPANVPVAGDFQGNDAAPTYASFGSVTTLHGDHGATDQTGRLVQERIDRAGNIRSDGSLTDEQARLAYFEPRLSHNIPAVFWNYMNSKGSTWQGNKIVYGKIVDWVFAMGLPISEPFWSTAVVGGQQKLVLIQLFERRVLTYTPSNDKIWQIEMGNVGRHYFAWRYNNQPVGILPGVDAPVVRLEIPSINSVSPIEYVGLANDGTMEIPTDYHDTAWYRYGPKPGEVGNAVINGHKDWYGVPQAIFYHLKDLQIGDKVYVYDTLGKRRSFTVYDRAIVSSEGDSALSNRIFGTTNEVHLNLITCAGTFDRNAQNYSERLVVFTRGD